MSGAERGRSPSVRPGNAARRSMSPAGAASSGQVLDLARAARALGLRCRRAARDEIGRLGLGGCKRRRLRPHLTGRLRAGAELQHRDPDLELVARAHPSRHAQLRVVHERAALDLRCPRRAPRLRRRLRACAALRHAGRRAESRPPGRCRSRARRRAARPAPRRGPRRSRSSALPRRGGYDVRSRRAILASSTSAARSSASSTSACSMPCARPATSST